MKMRIIYFLLIISLPLIAGSPLSDFLYLPVLSQDNPIHSIQENESSEEEEQVFSDGESKLFDSGEHRSIRTGFLLSLGVPGAGELYAGNPLKAGIFLGLEAAAWSGVLIYNKKGNDGEENYREFADAHWQFDYYYDWFVFFGDDSIYTEQLPVEVVISGSDTTYIPDKNHDYYEMIGKYDWFILGWEDLPNRDAIRDSTKELPHDAEEILEVLKAHEDDSDLRLEYMNMRKQTNDYFTTSKYFVGAVILNHILSAFDAAWTAKRSNDKLYEGFTFSPDIDARFTVDRYGNPQPEIVLNIAKF